MHHHRLSLIYLTLSIFLLSNSAYSIEEEDDEDSVDACIENFISDDKWLKESKDNCIVSCLSSQQATMATFACNYKPICEEFCKESKPEKRIEVPSCEEFENPSAIKQLFRLPILLINRERAQKLAQLTFSLMYDLYPERKEGEEKCNSWHNGQADAFRHCYWVCAMAKDLGRKRALKIADFYEWSHPNECEEAQMDYNNNRVGARIAQENKPCINNCQKDPNLTILEEEECK